MRFRSPLPPTAHSEHSGFFISFSWASSTIGPSCHRRCIFVNTWSSRPRLRPGQQNERLPLDKGSPGPIPPFYLPKQTLLGWLPGTRPRLHAHLQIPLRPSTVFSETGIFKKMPNLSHARHGEQPQLPVARLVPKKLKLSASGRCIEAILVRSWANPFSTSKVGQLGFGAA